MPTTDGMARRRAWIVTLLLAAGLAAAASFGINHQYDTARVRYAECASVRTSPDSCSAGPSSRPEVVWVFGGLAALLVVGATRIGVRDLAASRAWPEPTLTPQRS